MIQSVRLLAIWPHRENLPMQHNPGRKNERRSTASGWKGASLHALAVTLFILGLFYYWFALANRHVVFLYGHLGAFPFDASTRSRYWMAGLVACGALLALYALANWFLARLAGVGYRRYSPPAWPRVWLLSAVPLALGILVITTRASQPVLPFSMAAPCVLATWSGLALALALGSLAAQRLSELAWRGLAGAGLAPTLLLLRAVELPGQGLVSQPTAYAVAIGGVLAGALWLAAVAWLHARWRDAPYKASHILASGLGLGYLLLPLVHYLLLTPPDFHYISVADNFFASSWIVQLSSFSIAALLAAGATKLEAKNEQARTSQPDPGHKPDRDILGRPDPGHP
jgi:hypothetical protein